MQEGSRSGSYGIVKTARNTFFNWIRSNGQMVSKNVEDAILELLAKAGVSASPGFSFGRSGTVTTGAYLTVDTVPSNITGRIVPINGNITKIFVGCENADTFTVGIQKRVGAVYTDIATVSMVSSRKNTFSVSATVSIDDELCAYIKTGSARNVIVGLIIQGTI